MTFGVQNATARQVGIQEHHHPDDVDDRWCWL
jgi:hypothetical protein